MPRRSREKKGWAGGRKSEWSAPSRVDDLPVDPWTHYGPEPTEETERGGGREGGREGRGRAGKCGSDPSLAAMACAYGEHTHVGAETGRRDSERERGEGRSRAGKCGSNPSLAVRDRRPAVPEKQGREGGRAGGQARGVQADKALVRLHPSASGGHENRPRSPAFPPPRPEAIPNNTAGSLLPCQCCCTGPARPGPARPGAATVLFGTAA